MSAEISIERDAVVYAASELLKAAIVMRDVLESAHPQILVSMPQDLMARLGSYRYQGAFDNLPQDVQDEARELALSDPWLRAARGIHAEHSGAADTRGES